MNKIIILRLIIVSSTFFTSLSFCMMQALKYKNSLVADKKIITSMALQLNADTVISQDLIMMMASIVHSPEKNILRQTCTYLAHYIKKRNAEFVKSINFSAHEKDLNEILMFFSWNNRSDVIDCLKDKLESHNIVLSKSNRYWGIGGDQCSWPQTVDLSFPGVLKIRYICDNAYVTIDTTNAPRNRSFPHDAEIALLCAAIAQDEKSVEVLASKIKTSYDYLFYATKMELHHDIFNILIENNLLNAFALLMKYDPYGALNLYHNNDKTGDYDKPYIDYLASLKIDKKDMYIQLCRDCGGKRKDELEPKQNCIIC